MVTVAIVSCSSPATSQTTETTGLVVKRADELFVATRDLLEIKLAVDTMVDPTSDAKAARLQVERMVRDINGMVDGDTSNAGKLAAMRRYLYESGSWNNNMPFQYDKNDPLGEKPANRLLQHYLITKRGNCVTMPILFLAVGQRLGLSMTLAEAPLHLFVKYTDDDGKVWNLEPTSGGGFTRDIWYRKNLPMSDEAVLKGTYLRALSHEEAAVVIASFLLEDYAGKGQFVNALAVSDVLLRHYPNFAYGLVKQGSAYSGLLHQELTGKYTRVEDIPSELKAKADQWYRLNMEAFAKAEALGWRPQDGQIQ